ASAIVLVVGIYYLWGVQAAGYGFRWRTDLGGYYNHLARGFAEGHLYVPIRPSSELLAMPNPWSPSIDDRYRMQDMALFGGRYYLYFGAAPAVVLFLPWRLVTSHDLPENFALFLFCFGGYLFYCAAFLRLLQMAGACPRPLVLGVMLLALGVCQSVPFLLNRVWVYEIAIGGGYFFTAGGVYALTRGIAHQSNVRWLVIAGLMFGLATASRPDLMFAGGVAAAGLWFYGPERKRWMLSFLAGFGAILAAIAVYNYQRFGNPFEFGFRYQLAGLGQNRVDVSLGHLLPGIFHFLLAPPEFSAVFPWVRIVLRHPFTLPADYFVEPIVGAVWLAPFVIGIMFLPRRKVLRQVRALLWIITGSGVSIALFLMSTHLVTQRYEVDFLPLMVFAALTGFAAVDRPLRSTIPLVMAIIFGTVLNLAVAISGPYEEMLANRPQQYARLARIFSPIRGFRLLFNPNVQLEFDLHPQTDIAHQTLVTLGHGPHSYSLFAEGLRLISQTDQSTLTLDLPSEPVHLRLISSAGFIFIEREGRCLLRQPMRALVMAPSEITVTAPAVRLIQVGARNAP
ncbi:MAG TPA: hypothetical protein VKB88_12645, partial [Bryobacteraceae bacterium]|nr:hypothetical protein [Bryobacteraceae bacterium]